MEGNCLGLQGPAPFQPHPVGIYVKRPDSLTAIEAARVRHERFHHERTLCGEVPRDTLQAPNLFLLREQRKESTEHHVDQ